MVDSGSDASCNSCMAFTLTLKPEVEERLRALAEKEDRSMHKTVERAVEEYLSRREADEWTRQTARQIYADHAELFKLLGDR
jgi:predicted transcriptional regulator